MTGHGSIKISDVIIGLWTWLIKGRKFKLQLRYCVRVTARVDLKKDNLYLVARPRQWCVRKCLLCNVGCVGPKDADIA